MKRATLLLLPLACAAYALLAWRFDWLCDDAYISFRYARHLAEGQGLVFNPTREVPVEGYSNFLWVLWLGAFEWLGLKATLVSRWTSVTCGALLGAALVRCMRRGPGGTPASKAGASPLGAGLAALFLATLPAVGVWATGGLATMPTALALFLCYERLLGDERGPRPVAAAVFGLATALVRADGAVWVALLLVGVLWNGWLERRSRSSVRAVAIVAATLAVGVGAHVAWRLSMYGDWLPLTARVKAGFSTERLGRGLDYVIAWLLVMPALPIALSAGALRARALPTRTTVPCAVLVLGGMFYATWVGGDFMPFGRFLFPTLPFVALLFGAVAERLLSGAQRVALTALALACIGTSLTAAFDVNAVPEALRRRFDFRPDRTWQSELERRDEMALNARRWVLLGRALALHTLPSESLVIGGIGAVGYHCDLFLYDTYGLVTPEVVAHGRVLPGSSPGHDLRVNPPFFLDHDPTFLGAYLTTTSPLAADEPLPWWTDVRPPDWEKHRWSELVDVETWPLDPAAGFPEDAQLVLLRLR